MNKCKCKCKSILQEDKQGGEEGSEGGEEWTEVMGKGRKCSEQKGST